MVAAIRVTGLGKCYRLSGGARAGYRTLRDSMGEMARAPWRWWKTRTVGRGEDFWALRDVGFTVAQGEVVGIIGRNGAGKSTLLKILSRITRPTTGQVELHGRVGSLLEVGTGFHPELTGRENIYLNGSILGMSRREIIRKFDEIVAFSEIEHFLDTPVKRYSSGMYVRLAFAVAAHLEPEILIVDEVLAVGDASFQQRCIRKMNNVAKNGRTVFFVSHNMPAIQSLCRRVLLLSHGELIEEGAVDWVISRYLSDARCESNGHFDLREHPARALGSTPIIRELVMKNGKSNGSASFFPDEPVDIEIVIETPNPIREPRLAIAIEDSFGRRITTCATFFTSMKVDDIHENARYVCSLRQLLLGCGRYLISVSIGTKYTGLIDSIDNAAWFEVRWRNNYHNGESYLPVYGPVLTDSEWQRIS